MSLFQQDLPPGLIYVANWLSNEEHEKVLAEIEGENGGSNRSLASINLK